MVNITRIKQEVLGVMTLDKDYWPHYTKFKTSTINIESSGMSEQNLLAIFNGTLNFFNPKIRHIFTQRGNFGYCLKLLGKCSLV